MAVDAMALRRYPRGMRDASDPKLLRRLLRAKDHLDAAPAEDWPVRRLAAVAGVSPAHFARSFKAAFGIPPHRYLLSRRIGRAKTLLRDTGIPITDIAFETGWNSLGTFGRVFHDITGQTPTELRATERARPHALAEVPPCFVQAANRPNLKSAVSEKRREKPAASQGA
jgi:transcriptional regulator GlxA family with amidase domain